MSNSIVMNVLSEISIFGIEFVAVFCLISILLVKPFKGKIKLVAYALVGFFLFALIATFCPNYSGIMGYIITFIVLILVLNKKALGMILLSFGIRDLLEAIILEFIITFSGNSGSYNHSNYFPKLICRCVVLIMILLFIIIKEKKKIHVNGLSLNKMTQMYLIIGVMSLGAMVTFVQMIALENVSERIMRIGAFILGMGGLAISVAIVGAVHFYILNDMLMSEMKFKEEMIGQQKKYYMGLLDKEEKTKKFRHDIRAHISSIKEYLDEENYDCLKEYVDDMEIKVSEMKCDIQTGNHVINAVVSDIMSNYPEVKIIWEGRVSDNLNIKMIDLCIIFSNLLNNACREVHDLKEHNLVNVTIKIFEPALMISVSNYIENEIEVDKNYHVVKKHEYGHGYGLRNVQDSVHNYGGEFEIICKNNKFEVNIIIPNALN